MKRLLCIFTALFLVFSLCGCNEEEKFPTPTENFFVNDFANIIDDTAETEYFSKAAALDKATTAQVVIVTVDSLNGDTPENYALEIGRVWGVGSSEQNNGIVVLLAEEEREIYISVGYGLEGALPDSKTGRIIDVYGLEYFKNDDFSEGLLAVGGALINEVYLEYGLEPEAGYVAIENVVPAQETGAGKVAISWVALVILLVAVSFLSRRFGGGAFFFFGGPGPGGFSGRSSGSFGGFSGGGGSFGGGGAGRSF